MVRLSAALDHKVGDHAVERDAVVERRGLLHRRAAVLGIILGAFGQPDEIRHRQRGLFKLQLEQNLALRGFHLGVQPVRHFLVPVRRLHVGENARRGHGQRHQFQKVFLCHRGVMEPDSPPKRKDFFTRVLRGFALAFPRAQVLALAAVTPAAGSAAVARLFPTAAVPPP